MSEATGPQPTTDEIAQRLAARPDLLDRLRRGDSTALAEILEVATGSEVTSVEIRELA